MVSVLSWMVFLSAFSLVWVSNPWLSLWGHTIPLGFYICTLVYRVCKNAQKSSNYDSRLAVVHTDVLLFLGSTMTLSSFLGKDSSSLLQPIAV